MSIETTTERERDFVMTTINVNGIEYVPLSEVQKITGNRVVMVVDRGWIFAGNVIRENGRIQLTRAVHVIRWENLGFDGVIANPDSDQVVIKPLRNGVDLPEGSEIFSIPVPDDWGLQ